ncbi:hypothetical protein [Streptomyces sp. T028]|uniref:hypothetical protein n=1 Tax=Streptomyces sp. T028 TaxID=3394379 RepID=UPI003A8AF382
MGDANADTGHLYAVGFLTGIIKVGRSRMPEQRVATHKSDAELHGSQVKAVWISGPLDRLRQREHELIRFCEINGRLAAGQEHFRGLDLQAIIDFATANAIPTQEIRETPPESDPHPPNPKAERIAARLAAATGSEVHRKGEPDGIRLEAGLSPDLSETGRKAVLAVIADTDAYGHERTAEGDRLWALIRNKAEQNPGDR